MKTKRQSKEGVLVQRSPTQLDAVAETNPFDSFFAPNMAERAMNGSLTDSEGVMVEQTYVKVFHSQLQRTCKNCLSDAYFELFGVWKRGKKHFMDLVRCEYALKAGALLEIFSRSDMNAVNKNLTNELAEAHLRNNRDKIRFFSKYPPDWETRIS